MYFLFGYVTLICYICGELTLKNDMKNIKKWFLSLFNKHENNDYDITDLRKKFDSLKFWTPELINWIGKENDPIKLAVASCLINSREWPEWLPGRPENYKKAEGNKLYYMVKVHKILKNKSETIAPELYSYIWFTKYYCNYKEN